MADPTWLQIAQFIAYVALTLTGVTVAAASLFISYRNNFGWKPVLFMSGKGIKGDSADDGGRMYALMDFEFWNRRTYPLVLRGVAVELVDFVVDEDVFHRRDVDWHFSRGTHAYYRKSHTVERSNNVVVKFVGRMQEGQSLDALDATFKVDAEYYDPRLNKTFRLKQSFPYSFK